MRFYFAAAIALIIATSAVVSKAQPAAPPLELYGELPAISDVEVSPSGNFTAMLMAMRGERIVFILDSTGAPVKQLVVGDAKVRGIEWVGEEAILLLRSETERMARRFGGEKTEWWRANVIPLDDAREVVSVFADQRYIANAVVGNYGIRQVDGRWMGYFGGFRMGRASGERERILDDQPALYEVDLRTGKVDLLELPGDYPTLRDWVIGEDGQVVATSEIDAQTGSWRIRNAAGDTLARGKQDRGEFGMVGLNATGSQLIYSEFDDATDDRRRYSVPLQGGTTVEIWADRSIDSYVLQPFTDRIIGLRLADGSIEMEDDRIDVVIEETLDAFSFASSVRISDFTPDFSVLIASTSGNYDSGTWYRVDSRTGQRAILGLERPGIQGPSIGQVSTITYSAQDGTELEGILTLPPNLEAKNLPVIILPHGGPNAHDDEAFDWWAQAFVTRGYAVLQPNFRGSTNRGTAFVEAGNGEWGRKMQTDKSDGLMALAELGTVDPSRACIVGASYGGYAALAGVTIEQGIYRCAVSVNGVTDLRRMFRWRLTGSRDIFRRGMDRTLGKDSDLNALSPAHLSEQADAPILLIHGRDDTVVPYEQTAIMADALKDRNKPHELMTLAGEDHWLSLSETRQQMLAATIRFVEEHNPPD